MKLFIKYIKQFNTIIVSILNKKPNCIERKNNFAILFNNNQIVGLNIFNEKLNEEFFLEDKRLQEKVKPLLSNYFENLEFENQFIIAKVLKCEKIENTHLTKCVVNNGKEDLQIICGASNVREGMYAVLATIDSWMSDGTQITLNKLKGIESYGMLCSKKELKIENSKINDSGIIDLNVNDNYIGKSIWEVLNEK